MSNLIWVGIAAYCFSELSSSNHVLLNDIAPGIMSGKDKFSIAGKHPLYGSTGIIGNCERGTYHGKRILVARVGSIGHIQMVNSAGYGITDNTLVVNAGDYSEYVYHYLSTYDFTRITSGTTQPLITGGSLKKISIPFPSKEACSKISSSLGSIDAKLAIESRRCELYSNQRKYLLAKLFI